MTGGPENMPWPTETRVESNKLSLTRHNLDESGCLLAPWDVEGVGRCMGMSATLMERPLPYRFQLELARGKINQLRGQAWDWQAIGLQLPEPLAEQIRQTCRLFGKAVTGPNSDEGEDLTAGSLKLAYQTAEQLVRRYIDQIFLVRHQRQELFDTTLGCSVGTSAPKEPLDELLVQTFNTVTLPFAWNLIEPSEGNYNWGPTELLLEWAEAKGINITGGPLIDFSAARLPAWLWLWEQDIKSLTRFICGYVETVLTKYHKRIRTWQLSASSNNASVLQLGEDELLYLTLKLAETARRVDPELELTVGIGQPWGEYTVSGKHIRSPFLFADELIRAGLHISAFDLELIMGITPRGSYCRDLLETSRLLDTYSLLGIPLRVTMGYPSSRGLDPLSDLEQRVGCGYWRDGFTSAVQADWAGLFTELVLSKPYVRGATWSHFFDSEPHQFPCCGLVDNQGTVKPALHRLRQLRERHLH